MDESLRDPCARYRPEGYTQGHLPQVQQPRFIPTSLPRPACRSSPTTPRTASPSRNGGRLPPGRRRTCRPAAKAPKEAPRQYGGSGWPAQQPGGPPVRTLPCLVPVGPGRQQEPRPRTSMRYVRPRAEAVAEVTAVLEPRAAEAEQRLLLCGW